MICTHTESKLEIKTPFWNGHRHDIRRTKIHTFALADMHDFDSNLACNTHTQLTSILLQTCNTRSVLAATSSILTLPFAQVMATTSTVGFDSASIMACASSMPVSTSRISFLRCVEVFTVIVLRCACNRSHPLQSRKCTPFTSVSSDTTLTKPAKCVCIVSKPKTHLVCMYRTKYSRCRLNSSQVSNNKTKTLAKMSHVCSRHTKRGLNANGDTAVFSL